MSESHKEIAETEFINACVFLASHIGAKSKELYVGEGTRGRNRGGREHSR